MECLLCGAEIYNSNQLFCKQCKKDYHKDYLAVCKNIKDKKYNRNDANNIINLIEKKLNKQKIEDELNIPKNKLNWIVKYYYPDYEINYKTGKKTNNKIKPLVRITKQNIKDEIDKLNNLGICGTDISIITRISYTRLSNYVKNFKGLNKNIYPFMYKNIFDEWLYFTYIGNRKIFLISTTKETLLQKIKERKLDYPRFIE